MEKEKETFLIVGADGLIGRTLVDYLKIRGESVLGTTRRSDTVSQNKVYLDLSGDIAHWQPPRQVSIAYLCGAVTSLQRCREAPAQSAVVNVKNTVALIKTLVRNKVFVVFLSSSLVFDGSVPMQKAGTKLSPKTEYGRQKAEAERQLLALGNKAVVVRLTKVLTSNMPLFEDWIRKLHNNEVINPFSDMVMSPVSIDSVADILYRVGKKRLAGIIQVSGEKDVTYKEVAQHIAESMGANPALIQPIKSSESGLNLEAAPRYTTLDTSRLRRELGITLPGVWETVDSVLNLTQRR